MVKVVIDTNAFVSSLSTKSETHRLIELVRYKIIEVYLTTEIMLEYEEKLNEKYQIIIVENFIKALTEFRNVYEVKTFYYWNLLKDEDDNKFVDCYVAANADYLITNDKGFNQLKNVDFPKINTITLQDFLKITT